MNQEDSDPKAGKLGIMAELNRKLGGQQPSEKK